MLTRPRIVTAVLLAGVLLGRGVTSARAEPGRAPGPKQWVARYAGPFNNPDYGEDVAVAPDGSVVFVTGSGATADPDWSDFATLAYDAQSGAQLWLAGYDGPADADDNAHALAVSPDGSRVFVTGLSDFGNFEDGWATLAYDAATGAQVWVARIDNPSSFLLFGPTSIGVSPDGATVFASGAGVDPNGASAWITVAYESGTGSQRWIQYLPIGNGFPGDLAVSPDGTRVYVTTEAGPDIYYDIITVAFDATTGRRVGAARYSSPGHSQDYGYAVGVSPDGSKVFVTGEGAAHYVTLAYAADLSSRLWVSTYHGPGDTTDIAYALAVSPDSGQVSVTGYSAGLAGLSDYGTVTYDAATGAQLWVARYVGVASSIAQDLAYRPDGARLFVTGKSFDVGTNNDYVTVTYDAEGGQQIAVSRLDGLNHTDDGAVALAVSPLGTRVFVTGSIDDNGGDHPPTDYATVGYGAG